MRAAVLSHTDLRGGYPFCIDSFPQWNDDNSRWSSHGIRSSIGRHRNRSDDMAMDACSQCVYVNHSNRLDDMVMNACSQCVYVSHSNRLDDTVMNACNQCVYVNHSDRLDDTVMDA